MTPLTPLETQIDTWQCKIPQFAAASRGDSIRDLNEEVGELAKAAIDGEGDEAFYKEAADLYIVLAGMMALEGESLEEWVKKKMVRNENRVEFIISKLSARKRGQE